MSDGKFHKIQVRVKRSGVRVTARRGYWAPTEAESNPEPAPPADPSLTGALRELVTPGGPDRRVIDIWVGTEASDYGLSKVDVSWEAANRSAETPTTVELEPVTRTGASLYPAQTIGAAQGGRRGDRGIVPSQTRAGCAQGDRADSRAARSWTAGRSRWWCPTTPPRILKLGTPRVFRTRSLAETRAFDVDPEPTPTASRRFRRTDRLVIDVPTSPSGRAESAAKLTNRDGKVLGAPDPRERPVRRGAGGAAARQPGAEHLHGAGGSERGNNSGAQVVAFTVSQ